MGLSIKILGSSSKGNCGLLQTDHACFLIDAGFSKKQIQARLQAYGIALSDLSGIFITHEHQDHAIGLKALRQLPAVHFYANSNTAQAIETRYPSSLKATPWPWSVFTTGEPFFIDSLSVQTFPLPHDAAEPVGFLFRSGNESLAWATDIGHIDETVAQALAQADTLVIESNHDETLLWKHPTRPSSLKERIAQGHLSNADVFSFLQHSQHAWKEIYLAHVSAECNSAEILQALFQPLAQTKGFALHIMDPLAL